MATTYTARSASERTDDWSFWMVWNGKLNVTVRVFKAVIGDGWKPIWLPFVDREDAEYLASRANEMNLDLDGGRNG